MPETTPGKSTAPDERTQIMNVVALIAGMALTALTCFALQPLKEAKFNYLWAMICDRGPMPYMILVVTYMNAATIFLLNRTKTTIDRRTIRQLIFRCLLPVALGLLGTAMGYRAVAAQKAEYLASNPPPDELVKLEQNVAIGHAVVWDLTILGAVCTVFTLFPAITLISREKEKEDPWRRPETGGPPHVH